MELKELKILSIKKAKIDHQLKLETPLFTALVFWSQIELLKFNYPNQLRHLETLDFMLRTDPFANLETLVCQEVCCDYEDFYSLDLFHLKVIKNLARGPSRLEDDQFVDLGFKDSIKDELKTQKKQTGKMRLQIDAPNQFRQLMLPQLQFARFKNS